MSTFIFFLFGALIVAAAFSMAKIQRKELLAAREQARAKKARLDAFRAKCHRPDGD